ncbi:signal peptidase I [Sphingomonas oligophenolica]|uniref:Signal peptidase I n=1 Tax=Sphingomonas oligophenolica TaxID=301154 RepID=A0ABU9Y5I3_9SPHN
MTDTNLTAPPPSTRTGIRWLAEIRGILMLLLLVIGLHSLIAKPFYIPSESMMPGLQVGDRLVVSKYPYGWSYASASFHLLPFVKGRLFGRMPDRGDIVIVIPPGADRRGEDLIKRVIGLPGDRIQLSGGRVRLNGKPIETRDMGYRLLPIDGNFRCDAHDPDPERAFWGFAGARVIGNDGKAYCRLHMLRETLPGGRYWDTLDFGRSEEDDFPPYTVPAGHLFLLGDNRDNSADSRVPLEFHGLGGAVPFENIGGRAEFVTFSLKGDATWNPLSWFSAFRGDRAGTSLRPETAH